MFLKVLEIKQNSILFVTIMGLLMGGDRISRDLKIS